MEVNIMPHMLIGIILIKIKLLPDNVLHVVF
jgi:hypothetical protein